MNNTLNTMTILAKDLSDHTLVGDMGGTSVITGDVAPSSTYPGSVVVETEHGTLYFEAHEEVLVVDERTTR